MDRQRILRLSLRAVLSVVGFLAWTPSILHRCDRQSVWFDLPMLICFLVVIPTWATRAGSASGHLSLRTVGAVVLMIGLQVSYSSWVHSDYFPTRLLFPPPHEHETRHPNRVPASKKG